MVMFLSRQKPFDRPWQLRTRILRVLLVTLSGLWLATALAVGGIALRKSAQDADAAMLQTANLLLRFFEHEYQENGGNIDTLDDMPRVAGPLLSIRLWDAQGRLLLGDPRAPFGHSEAPRFRDLEYDGQTWRVLTVWTHDRRLELQMAETITGRVIEARELMLALVLALIITVLVAGILVWGAIQRAINPVAVAASHLARRGADDFSDLPAVALPAELTPLVEAFNGLLQRLAQSLDRERVFAAMTAHELRTPLAAIRLNAQLAQRDAEGATSRALSNVIAGVDRSVRMLDQLLTIARLDSETVLVEHAEPLQLRRLIEEVTGDVAALVQERGISLHTEAPDEPVLAPARPVQMLLRNLIDNALRYCAAGGQVQVLAQRLEQGWSLEVADDGRGLPEAQCRVLRGEAWRSRRPDGSGTGLGLAIVRRVVELLGARIELGIGLQGRGTRIRVVVNTVAALPGPVVSVAPRSSNATAAV